MGGAATEARCFETLFVHRAAIGRAPMRVMMVMVMVMVMMVVVIEILRQLRVCFSLCLRLIDLLEERKRVRDSFEELREGLRPQKFIHIGSTRRGCVRTVQGCDGGYDAHRANELFLHLILLPV